MSTDYVTKKYGGGEGAGVTTPSTGQQTSEQIFEDDVNGFSSTSDICFMLTA
jgi:hypothetical protein